MAEFCKQCAEEMGFEPDFTGLFERGKVQPKPDYGFPVLCEGCGPFCFVVDDQGTCGAPDCDEEHGLKVSDDQRAV